MLPNLLSGLPLEAGVVTRQISAENPTGEKGGGCHWIPDPNDPNLAHSAAASDLGKGWKVRPFIAAQKYTCPILLDPGGAINKRFLVQGIPKSLVYDRTGKLVAQSPDMRTMTQFLEMLKRAGLE